MRIPAESCTEYWFSISTEGCRQLHESMSRHDAIDLAFEDSIAFKGGELDYKFKIRLLHAKLSD